MKNIGLHLRVYDSFTHMIEKAVHLEIPIFQSFLVSQETERLLPLSDQDVVNYLAIRRRHFNDLYVHGSYRINLAGVNEANHFALRRELGMAKRLEFTHMVIHPGAAAGLKDKREGVEVMARLLNTLIRYEHDIKIVLENAAHGNRVVGNDLQDFGLLRSLLDQPDKILYCIDTAHAHAYGYPLHTAIEREQFLQAIDHNLGIRNVALLHLNDTYEKMGSKRDRHALIGSGDIGDDTLKAWVKHPKLAYIPIIMELPEVDEEKEKNILTKVRSWYLE